MIITFSFLVLYTVFQPFCTPGLSKTMSFTLIAQFISLYAGICLVVEAYKQKDLINAGQDDTTSPVSGVFGTLIVGINLALFLWPFIMVLASGEFAEKFELVSKQIQTFLKIEKHHDSEPISNNNKQICNSENVHGGICFERPVLVKDENKFCNSENVNGEAFLNDQILRVWA
jgi:hypothetical protein